MIANPKVALNRSLAPRHTRRPRRMSALNRAIERAEYRFDRRELLRQSLDPEEQGSVPLDEVLRDLGL